MIATSPEYEIVWTGQIETQAIKAQQIQAAEEAASRPRFDGAVNSRVTVLNYVARHPGVTLYEIIGGTGLGRNIVNGALQRLAELGYVVRSHRQNDDRSQAVKWRVKA